MKLTRFSNARGHMVPTNEYLEMIGRLRPTDPRPDLPVIDCPEYDDELDQAALREFMSV